MFDCKQTREFLDLYLDNELESAPTKHVAEHLERCVGCRRELELMRSQNELLARSIKEEPFDTTELRGKIEAATVKRPFFRFPEFALPHIPAWVFAIAFASVIGFAALFYLPGRIGVALADPLYRAAAADHLACAADSAASDWIRSQEAISEMATSFINARQIIPSSLGDNYRLARARICNLRGVSFLHVIYERTDGRQLSFFIGRPVDHVPSGEITETPEGRNLQVAHVSNLAVFCTLDGNRLLLTTAPDETVARVALLSVLDRL
ncbi:MAG: zf-HC2 domain-containing protein [Acidobacteria bacterium]|nr:zf-HC2 domain-containing protein [Acidobacteriota bacterium]